MKAHFLESTELAQSLVKMGGNSQLKLDSGREVRRGYMALVVYVANLLVCQATGISTDEPLDKPTDSTIASHLSSQPTSGWIDFITTELASANAKNNRVLGQQSPVDDSE